MYAIEEKGKIKFYSSIPDVYNNDIAFGMRTDTEHKAAGFLLVVQPTLTSTQKLGEVYKDLVNEVYTYRIVEKTTTELEQEKADKLKVEQEKIKAAKLDKIATDAINANPLITPTYFPDWVFKTGGYPLLDANGNPIIVRFNLKIYKNILVGNINSPDKGGWTEIK